MPALGNPRLQIVRALMSVAMTLGYFAAVQTLPVAEAPAIYFIYPLVITTLPPLILGAALGIRRWAAVAAGFAGA